MTGIVEPAIGSEGWGPVLNTALTDLQTQIWRRGYDVVEYGAVGDGTTDDAAAIQAALDAAYAAGGGLVVFPAGHTFAVSTFVAVRDNTLIWAYGATLKAIGNTGILRNFLDSETPTAYTGHSHITVLGGVWDGNAADGTTGTVTAETDVLNFIHCADITVRDVTIRNTSTAHALEFNSTDGGRAINCRFEGFSDNSSGLVRQFSEAIQIDIAHSGSSSIGAFDDTTSRSIRIEGCYFGPSDRLGVFGRAVGSHTIVAGATYDDIDIVDCRINGTIQEGIYGYGWRRARIAGNIITGTGASGVLVTVPDPATTAVPAHTVTVEGNEIEGAGADSAIRVLSPAGYQYPGAVITSNTVKSITGNAIHVEGCIAPVVADNRADTTSSTGIYANYSPDTVISGNVVRNGATNAINATGSPGATITGNTVDTTASNYGIFTGQAADGATNTTDATIAGNTVIAAASAGIRLSTGSSGCTVTGNKVRKGAGATVNGITLASTCSGCVITNNDLSGNGWTTSAAVVPSTSAPITDTRGGTSLPGSNAVNALVASGGTVANTVATGTLASGIIPAGDAVAGTQYRLTASGQASTTGAPTLALNVALSGTTLATPRAAAATGSGLANVGWQIEVLLTCITAGASGTWQATVRLTAQFGGAGTVAVATVQTATSITKDSTAQEVLSVTSAWGTASASNTITANSCVLERVA